MITAMLGGASLPGPASFYVIVRGAATVRVMGLFLATSALGCLPGSYYTVVDNDLAQRDAVSEIVAIVGPAVARSRDIVVTDERSGPRIQVGYHVVGRVSRNVEIHVIGDSVWVSVHEVEARPGDPPARDPRMFDEAALAGRIEQRLRAGRR